MKRYAIVVLYVFLLCFVSAQQVNIIPKPQQMELKEGVYFLDAKILITYNHKEAKDAVDYLSDFLTNHYQIDLQTKQSSKLKSHSIHFNFDAQLQDESYTLIVSRNTVEIKGGYSGLFYGLQSLLQLMPLEHSSSMQLPQVEIHDSPRFKHRGAMMDVGRYFYPVEDVKRFIDLIAAYKLNVFHWHLTEDAGWRIEIKKYPLLTEVGAWRRGTQSNHNPQSFDRLPHGGYYTQEQMKEVVEYARKRNITVIPEIDMPGHTLSLLAAYPEVSCTGGPFKVLEQWGIQEDVLCAGNEKTYRMLEDIFDELLEIFPSKIIHIGGDEAPKNRWKACPVCQEKIKTEGLKNEDELQSYFIKRVAAYLRSKGRSILGWDEIMEGGLAPGAMVMSWRGEAGGIQAAQMQHEVVMVPNIYLYLDYYQAAPEIEPFNIWGDVPLDWVYGYEPCSAQIPEAYHPYIIGLQGNLWAEFIHTREKLDYMGFPRLLAVAEIGWSNKEKDLADFRKRLAFNLRWLDKKQVNFRIPEPFGLATAYTGANQYEINVEAPVEQSKIYYTIDGSDPMQYGILYEAPIDIHLNEKDSVEFKYVIRTETGRVSGTRKSIYKR